MEIHGTNAYGGVILNNAITWRRFNDLGQSRDLLSSMRHTSFLQLGKTLPVPR